jgi:hypothetical protein
MIVLDRSKLSEDELDALPCVCCGGQVGVPPGAGTYGICPYCSWEDCPVQYKYPWTPGGPNYYSLWQSRRNFKSSGSSDGYPIKRRWPASAPTSVYDWDIDPSFYADHAGGYKSECPVIFARDVLRAAGFFSRRQIWQRAYREQLEEPGYLRKIKFGHQAISMDSGKEKILRVDITNIDSDSSHEYIKRLAAISESTLEQLSLSFSQDSTGRVGPHRFVGESKHIAKIDNDDYADPNAYWVRLAFSDDQLESVVITATENGEDGWDEFKDLDKDREN